VVHATELSWADMKTYRQISLFRSDLRKLLNLPDDVQIAGMGISQEPLRLQITVSGEDGKYWTTAPDLWASEDDESYILSKEVLDKWQSQ
jgi:hypothetical protein